MAFPSPGPVVTQFCRSMGFDAATSEALFNGFAPQMLMKRVGQPEDIANLASFLASDDAINITGSIYVSDSGALLSMPEVKPDNLESFIQK